MQTFLTQYYHHQPNLPEEIMVPSELPDLKLVEKWLKTVASGSVKLLAPKIGDGYRLVQLANKNARTVWALLAHDRHYEAGYEPAAA